MKLQFVLLSESLHSSKYLSVGARKCGSTEASCVCEPKHKTCLGSQACKVKSASLPDAHVRCSLSLKPAPACTAPLLGMLVQL